MDVDYLDTHQIVNIEAFLVPKNNESVIAIYCNFGTYTCNYAHLILDQLGS